MKKVSIVLIVMILTGAFPISCGCGFDVKDFRIISMDARSLTPIGSVADTLKFHRYDSLLKNLYPVDVEYVSLIPSFGGALFPNAVACDPPNPVAVQKIVQLRITAMDAASYDSENDIAAGDDVTDRFLIGRWFFGNYEAIDNYLDNPWSFGHEGVNLKMASPPLHDTELKFRVLIVMDDNKQFTFDELLKLKGN